MHVLTEPCMETFDQAALHTLINHIPTLTQFTPPIWRTYIFFNTPKAGNIVFGIMELVNIFTPSSELPPLAPL